MPISLHPRPAILPLLAALCLPQAALAQSSAARSCDMATFTKLALHCGGGPSTDRFDLFGALVDWAEHGKAPASPIATARPDNRDLPSDWSKTRTRPLCAWPKVARYRGTGDLESAESFVCE